MTDRKAAIRKFIVQNFQFGQEITISDDDSLLNHGIIDSTGMLELVMHLESTYGIKVKDEELLPGNLDSLAAINAYLERKLSPPTAGQ